MNAWQFHADGIQQIMDEAGAACPQILWAGNLYNLLPGSARLRKDLKEGGFDADFDFACTALLAQFPYANTDLLYRAMCKTSLQYMGEIFRVESVWLLAGGFQVQINCNAANQRQAGSQPI